MAYFRTCPRCGGNLDPGEICDCRDEMEEKRQRTQEMMDTLIIGKGGQMVFGFMKEERTVGKAAV